MSAQENNTRFQVGESVYYDARNASAEVVQINNNGTYNLRLWDIPTNRLYKRREYFNVSESALVSSLMQPKRATLDQSRLRGKKRIIVEKRAPISMEEFNQRLQACVRKLKRKGYEVNSYSKTTEENLKTLTGLYYSPGKQMVFSRTYDGIEWLEGKVDKLQVIKKVEQGK